MVPEVTVAPGNALAMRIRIWFASRMVSNIPKYWRSPEASTTSTVYRPKRDSGA
ncbi:hypothetical protein D3C87_2102970 [compost metagenome]